MANYSLVVNSKFSPFTYQELLQPALLATQAHQELENQYADLATKANVWEGLANEQTDPEVYNMYKKYSDDLQKQAELLASQGLTPSSRKALTQMKSRYSSEIIPIENAYKTRQSQAEQQQQALLKDPTLMFSRRASTTSLSDYMRNPQLSYEIVSGADLSNRVAAQASSLASSLQAYGEGKPIDAYTNTFIKKYGFTKEQIQKAINNPSEGDPVLNAIVENTIASTGMGQLNEMGELIGNGWADIDTLNKAYSYARQGLSKAVGKQDVQMFEDIAARENLKYKNNTNLELFKAALKADTKDKKDKDKNNDEIIFNPRINEGVEGEISDIVKRTSGLRRTSTGGYSTTALDSADLELKNATKALDDFSKTHDIKALESYSSKVSSLGQAMNKSITNPTPKGKLEYDKLKRRVVEAQKKVKEEKDYLDSIYNKYKHLASNSYDAMEKGLKLEDMQEKQSKTSFTLGLKDSDYNNVRDGIYNIINSFTESGPSILKDADGKSLSYKETQKVIGEGFDKSAIKVSGGNNPSLKIVKEGKEYTIHNVEQIDKFNKDLKVVNDYLKDFSSTVTNAVEIDSPTLMEIYKNGVNNISLPANYGKKITPILNEKGASTGYKGLVLHEPKSGDYVKIMLDKANRVVAVNTLEGELAGGEIRDSYFINMANKGLSSLPGMLSRKAE